MSGKLDQSLDEIVSSRRAANRGRGRGRGRVGTRAAPVGGVQKNTRSAAAAAATKAATVKAAAAQKITGGDQKIIVSNLPPDVDERQIKEYFGKTVGHIKRATLQYGPNGASRGIATIIFSKPGMANEAVAQLNGLRVDERPMKVELIVDASRVAEPKSMSDRVSKSTKAQPKQAGATKATDTSTRGAGRPVRGSTRGRPRRGRNAGRPKNKTSDELDAEMTDYFAGGTAPEAAVTNGAPAAADDGMDGVA